MWYVAVCHWTFVTRFHRSVRAACGARLAGEATEHLCWWGWAFCRALGWQLCVPSPAAPYWRSSWERWGGPVRVCPAPLTSWRMGSFSLCLMATVLKHLSEVWQPLVDSLGCDIFGKANDICHWIVPSQTCYLDSFILFADSFHCFSVYRGKRYVSFLLFT